MNPDLGDEGRFLAGQSDLACAATTRIRQRVVAALTDGGAARGAVADHPVPALGVALAAGVAAGMQVAAMCDRRSAIDAAEDLQRAAGVAPAGLSADGLPGSERNLMTEFLRMARALGIV